MSVVLCQFYVHLQRRVHKRKLLSNTPPVPHPTKANFLLTTVRDPTNPPRPQFPISENQTSQQQPPIPQKQTPKENFRTTVPHPTGPCQQQSPIPQKKTSQQQPPSHKSKLPNISLPSHRSTPPPKQQSPIPQKQSSQQQLPSHKSKLPTKANFPTTVPHPTKATLQEGCTLEGARAGEAHGRGAHDGRRTRRASTIVHRCGGVG